jgi:hypothetical protein
MGSGNKGHPVPRTWAHAGFEDDECTLLVSDGRRRGEEHAPAAGSWHLGAKWVVPR